MSRNEGEQQNSSPSAKNANGTMFSNNNRIKSPSDTSIYAPALNFTPDKGKGINERKRFVVDKISDFVESIRLDQ